MKSTMLWWNSNIFSNVHRALEVKRYEQQQQRKQKKNKHFDYLSPNNQR